MAYDHPFYVGQFSDGVDCLLYISSNNWDDAGNPQEGMVYYNLIEDEMYYYDGTQWVLLTGGGNWDIGVGIAASACAYQFINNRLIESDLPKPIFTNNDTQVPQIISPIFQFINNKLIESDLPEPIFTNNDTLVGVVPIII